MENMKIIRFLAFTFTLVSANDIGKQESDDFHHQRPPDRVNKPAFPKPMNGTSARVRFKNQVTNSIIKDMHSSLTWS